MLTKITAPTNCPSCNSKLEWSNHILYCRNPLCISKAEKRIEHFAKSLKIKGLGPVTVKKLGIFTVSELYSLTKEDIAQALSSERMAEKLYHELENSKNAPLNMVLPAFSIPLIGRTASEKLSTVAKNIYDIDETRCRHAGLGPKATANLLNWIKNEFPIYESLPFDYTFKKTEVKEVAGVVCITGKLSTFRSKAIATDALKEAGYVVKSSVTKDCTHLINESGIESAKTKKARESGITVVSKLTDLINI